MKDLVTFFPDWRDEPYIRDLLTALTDQGWRCEIVNRKGLWMALGRAICGRGTVHIHWFEGFHPGRTRWAGLLAWLYVPFLWITGRRGRLLWTVHNLIPHQGYAPFVGNAFVGSLARSCSRILVHFEETRQSVVRRFGLADRVIVVPPARFGEAHGPRVDRSSARASISRLLTDSSKLLVQIGTMRGYKQPATTISAFREGAPASAMLLIAGPCRDETLHSEMIRAAAGDPRIILRLTYQSDEDLVRALCAADWSICPYTLIDYPGALDLSVSYGCPVIAPRLPPVCSITTGHPAILYSTDGPALNRLGEAIRLATTIDAAPPDTHSANARITREEQARRTAEQYLAARNS